LKINVDKNINIVYIGNMKIGLLASPIISSQKRGVRFNLVYDSDKIYLVNQKSSNLKKGSED